jgi:gamma-glutamyltranspeptidase/glutathione hydrolase
VPGTVAGLLWAHERFGRLDRATVLGPAIRAAEEGFAADASWVAATGEMRDQLAAHPELREAASSLWGTLCRAGHLCTGDHIRNPPQAEALRRIARQGRDAFYHGPIADAMVSAVAASGGSLTRDDLAGYRPRVLRPLRGTFLGRTILSMPPPSSGGVAMQQIFGILERRRGDLEGAGPRSPRFVHVVVEAMKHAFADRARFLADADFAPVPLAALLDPAHLDSMAARIELERTHEPSWYGSPISIMDDAGTSHLSVIDAEGMAVACTETINTEFGSLVAVPGWGFALNNEMDDFTTIAGAANVYGLRQSDWNLPEPGKRPLSSMSPTIVLDGDRVVMVAGAAGGPRIITATVQCMLSSLLHGMPAGAALAAPRVHHQWQPDVVQLEERWPDDGLRESLRAMGHAVGEREDVGVVQMIRAGPAGLEAASDPREGGRPAGW